LRRACCGEYLETKYNFNHHVKEEDMRRLCNTHGIGEFGGKSRRKETIGKT
jgi:hypothetical protein